MERLILVALNYGDGNIPNCPTNRFVVVVFVKRRDAWLARLVAKRVMAASRRKEGNERLVARWQRIFATGLDLTLIV